MNTMIEDVMNAIQEKYGEKLEKMNFDDGKLDMVFKEELPRQEMDNLRRHMAEVLDSRYQGDYNFFTVQNGFFEGHILSYIS